MPISIEEIPSVTISQIQIESKLQCGICLENFNINENARQLICQHIYHDPCIQPWFERHTTCPTCRKAVIQGEPDSTLDWDSSEEHSSDEEMPFDEEEDSTSSFSDNLGHVLPQEFHRGFALFQPESDQDSWMTNNDDGDISESSTTSESTIDEESSPNIRNTDNEDSSVSWSDQRDKCDDVQLSFTVRSRRRNTVNEDSSVSWSDQRDQSDEELSLTVISRPRNADNEDSSVSCSDATEQSDEEL